jgi:hypothetical protein
MKNKQTLSSSTESSTINNNNLFSPEGNTAILSIIQEKKQNAVRQLVLMTKKVENDYDTALSLVSSIATASNAEIAAENILNFLSSKSLKNIVVDRLQTTLLEPETVVQLSPELGKRKGGRKPGQKNKVKSNDAAPLAAVEQVPRANSTKNYKVVNFKRPNYGIAKVLQTVIGDSKIGITITQLFAKLKPQFSQLTEKTLAHELKRGVNDNKIIAEPTGGIYFYHLPKTK